MFHEKRFGPKINAENRRNNRNMWCHKVILLMLYLMVQKVITTSLKFLNTFLPFSSKKKIKKIPFSHPSHPLLLATSWLITVWIQFKHTVYEKKKKLLGSWNHKDWISASSEFDSWVIAECAVITTLSPWLDTYVNVSLNRNLSAIQKTQLGL